MSPTVPRTSAMPEHSLAQALRVLAIFVSGCGLLWTGMLSVAAQNRRPQLRIPARITLAGSMVLLPLDARVQSLIVPRQLAQLADHELQTPPANLYAITDTAQRQAALLTWLATYDFTETDALVIALDALPAQGATGALAQLAAIHQRWRGLPICAFSSITNAAQWLPLLKDGTLTQLLLCGAAPAALANEFAAERNSKQRLSFAANADAAAQLLLAAALNRRFGFAPPIAVTLATEAARQHMPDLQLAVNTLGATAPAANRRAELNLVIHVPQQNVAADTLRTAIAIQRIAETGARVVLVDAAGNATHRAALLAELRKRKLFDRLAAYAAAETVEAVPAALARALAQASTWYLTMRFLRGDLEQLRRTERAQVAMLLANYLRDGYFQAAWRNQRPALSPEPGQPDTGDQTPPAMRALVDELFKDQFWRNVHAVLLENGERVEFIVERMQLFQTHFWPADPLTPDIRINFHMSALQNGILLDNLKPAASWQLANPDNVDSILQQRFLLTPWHRFKTDAELAEISFQLVTPPAPKNKNAARANTNESAIAESYAIRSKRSGTTRRFDIQSSTLQGAYYALGKLELLGADGLLGADFQINEQPQLAQRGVVEDETRATLTTRDHADLLQMLGRMRLNRFYYAAPADIWRNERWREPLPKADLLRMRFLQQTAAENFVTFVYTLNPVGLRMLDAATVDPKELAALLAKCRTLTNRAGIRDFALTFAGSSQLSAAQASWREAFARGLQSFDARFHNLPPNVATLTVTGPPEAEIPLLRSFSTNALPPPASTELLIRLPRAWRSALLPLATAAEAAWDQRTYKEATALKRALAWQVDPRQHAAVNVWLNAFAEAGTLTTTQLDELQTALAPLGTTRAAGLLRGEWADLLQKWRQ